MPAKTPNNAPEPGSATEARQTLYIDYGKCIGCETCEAVCRFIHALPRIVTVRTVGGETIPLYCRHCEHPHCVKVCKRDALSVDAQGAVILDAMRCRGCETRACILGCPYGGMLATGDGIGVNKCDLCRERRKQGENPACAEMCPCGAIYYIDREAAADLETEKSRLAAERVLAHIRAKSV